MDIARVRSLVAELQRELDAGPEQVDSLDRFIAEKCFFIKSREMPLSDFWKAFKAWLPKGEQADWNKSQVAHRLTVVSRGRQDQPKKMIIGLSWTPPEPVEMPNEYTNPDFDGTAMCKEIHRLRNEGHSFDRISDMLNHDGKLDQRGEPWTENEVKRVWAD